MKNFILGIIATIGGLAVCSKVYEKGYNEALEENKPNKELKDSSKDKKTKTK